MLVKKFLCCEGKLKIGITPFGMICEYVRMYVIVNMDYIHKISLINLLYVVTSHTHTQTSI